MMYDLGVECGPTSFHIPVILSNGTVLVKTGVLAFYQVVCSTRVPYVVDKCFVLAARFQQHLSLTILGLS